jgi:HAE1 family hydrophobic/amphiphilic exporter-1
MSWITRMSLRNRSVVALVVIAVLILGVFAVQGLRQELMPNIEFPALTIFTMQPGASPADVERGITTPIEASIKGLSGLEDLTSYSNEGVSIIVAMFQYGADMEANLAATQQAVSRVQPYLPSGTQPQVQAINFGDLPVVQLAVTSPLPAEQVAALLQSKVVPRLQQITGVADVSLSGAAGSQLQIEIQPMAMATLGVTPQAIAATLQSANVSMPAGTVVSDGTSIPVRVTSQATDLEALSALPVQTGASLASALGGGSSGAMGGGFGSGLGSGGTTQPTAASAGTATASADQPQVTLGDVATLSIVASDATSITRTNGVPSVGISVTKSADGNSVDISQAVNDLIPEMQSDLGEGAEIITVVDQAPYITDSISHMWKEGIIGALFAVVVILLFLRSWRSTIVAGISIPLSVIVALIILWGRADSLNMLTLAGLTIAIGRVIDDAIVVLENAYRHLQEGDDARTAAYTATKEVSAAITASTLTTVAVFLPLGFVSGISSEFFRPFALTVTFALMASLLVALTVVPVAVTWLLKKRYVGHRESEDLTFLQRLYLPSLRWAISHKLITTIAAFAVFAASLALVPLLETNLLDTSEETTFTISQQMPAGTDAAVTSEAAAQVEAMLADIEGITVYQVTIGSTGSIFGAGGVNASSSLASFIVDTDGEHDKEAMMAQLETQIDEAGGLGDVSMAGGGGFGGDASVIEVRIYADDPAVLAEANTEVVTRLGSVSALSTVTSNLSERMPQIAVSVDPVKADEAGLDATTIGGYVGLILNGMPVGIVPTEAGPLVGYVRLPATVSASTDDFGSLPLASSSGIITLDSVADVTQVEEPVQVTHTDGQRTVTVSATSADDNVGAASAEIRTALEDLQLPEGARWELSGATEQMDDMFRSLSIAMMIAVIVVYLIMVGTFRSLLNPLILLVSIPFAAVGAIVLLLLTNTNLGMPSLIGLLMLIGIVVTNAIVLLDLVEQFRDKGMDAETAILEGGKRRMRPIMMTAVATILALSPMALGLGEGSFLSRPLAVVVIGGLISSTALTLIIVPVVYMVFDQFRRRPQRVEFESASETTGGSESTPTPEPAPEPAQ